MGRIMSLPFQMFSRAVASLTVPDGQKFNFPHFSSNRDSFFLLFLKLCYFLPHFGPTREGPGYATDVFPRMLVSMGWVIVKDESIIKLDILLETV